MSATSPEFKIVANAAGRTIDLRAIITRLSFKRRFLRVFAHVVYGLTSVLVLLLLVGVVDYLLQLSRALRVALAVLILSGMVVLIAYAVLSLARRRRLTDMARDVERATKRGDNALVTFAETLEPRSEDVVKPYMRTRLEAQAQLSLSRIDVDVVAPRRNAVRSFFMMTIVIVILFGLSLFMPTAFAREVQRLLWLESNEASKSESGVGNYAGAGSTVVSIESFRVRVVPPSYSGLTVVEDSGDTPLRVLSGSQVEVEMNVRGRVGSATLGFGGKDGPMRLLSEGSYGGSFIANESGAFEARVIGNNEQPPVSIVRAVEVYSDSPPDVRITSPSSDQLLRAVPAEPISVQWTAQDDLGLTDVVLKYIRSRGEGDAAQFVNGSMPLSVMDRAAAREWRGGAMLPLARLGLQPGDTLVYWIEARDRNPNANNVGRSASLAIAIIAPEPVKLNLGDLGPTEIGRFLLSERMIINHTEALHAKRSRLPQTDFLQQANNIAAEQREFKDSFNEYINREGGHETSGATSESPESVEERVREAEEERTGVHMHGIPDAPSGSPSNVRDMIFAIRAMWDAEAALAMGETGKALVHEREALSRLKSAQSAVRYIPPVFAKSKPIDLKRRYAGELNEIKTRLEKLGRAAESKEAVSLRAALTDAYVALGEMQATFDVPVTARSNAVARARERVGQSANRLAGVGGDHTTTIAEALAQLRIVEAELSRLDLNGTADDYGVRLSKPMSLLSKATASLFAIAEVRTRANGGEANTVLPTDEGRTSDYFRRLNK